MPVALVHPLLVGLEVRYLRVLLHVDVRDEYRIDVLP